MSNLLGVLIEPNYKGILNLEDLNTSLSATPKYIDDGQGNHTTLRVSTLQTQIVNSGLAATQDYTKGFLLTNLTDATVGTTVQISPPTIWSGSAWKSTATAAAQTNRFAADVVPVTGTSTTTAYWRLGSDINATGTFTNRLIVHSSGMVGINTIPSSLLHLSGNLSASNWANSGINFQAAAATYTNTSSSGTVALNVINSFGTPTIAASSATAFISAATVYISAGPGLGANVSAITDSWALLSHGKIGIGTELGTTVATGGNGALFQIGSSTLGAPLVLIDSYGSGVAGGLVGRHANGTPSSPTVPTTNDTLNFIAARGWDGSVWSGTRASITMTSPALWVAGSSNPTQISINTTAASAVAVTEAVRITSTQKTHVRGLYAGAIGTDPTAFIQAAAGTTSSAQIRLEPGVAPSAPNDGDIYYINTADRLMFFKNATACEVISASAVTTEVVVSDTTLTITFNGTTYKLLAVA